MKFPEDFHGVLTKVITQEHNEICIMKMKDRNLHVEVLGSQDRLQIKDKMFVNTKDLAVEIENKQ